MLKAEEILKLGNLAGLEIAESELVSLTNDCSRILDYVGQLERIDVSEVDPMCHVHGISNVFRKDVVSSSSIGVEILESAPERETEFFKVPLVIEHDSGEK